MPALREPQPVWGRVEVARLILLTLLLLQDKPVIHDLKERSTVTGGDPQDLKVSVDGVPLYEGPGAKAFVEAVENANFPGKKFVIVRVDGEERVRLIASSLAKPLAVPSTKVGAAEQISLQRETDGTTMTLTVMATSAGREEKSVIYEGPHAEHDLASQRDSMEVTVAGTVIYRIRRARAGPAKAQTFTVDDFVKRLNVFRKAAGVPDAVARASLHRGCDLHASYLAKNRPANAHSEDPALPGYTEEGARTGPASVIQQFGGRKDLREALDSLVSVIYHRQPLLHPGLREVGVGWAWDSEGRGVVVIHVSNMVDVKADPVIYPPAGAKDVPVEFALGGRENPDPLPDPKARAGYPVTVQFDGAFLPIKATAKLSLEGREIACWVSTPESPARADHPQPDLVGIIPKEILLGGKTYHVEFACDRKDGGPWKRTWAFTTKSQ